MTKNILYLFFVHVQSLKPPANKNTWENFFELHFSMSNFSSCKLLKTPEGILVITKFLIHNCLRKIYQKIKLTLAV